MVGYTRALADDSIFGLDSSLAIDSQGRPHISYSKTDTMELVNGFDMLSE